MAIRLIVLAAGKGTRMKSALPKVLHRLAGKPLLAHVLDTGAALDPASMTVVIGFGADQVKAAITRPVQWAMQAEQIGTGHAVRQGLDGIEDEDLVLITYGDVPLTREDTFRRLLAVAGERSIGVVTVIMDDPTGYGRMVRDANGRVTGIVEQKDATPEQLAIREGNAGVFAIQGRWLKDFLGRLTNDNAQGEYYLTDIVGFAASEGLEVHTVQPGDDWEVEGVNSRRQLAALERIHQRSIADALMDAGTTLADPARLDVRGTLETGTDVTIDVNCVFIGQCRLGNNVTIESNCVLIDADIGAGTTVHPNSVIEQSHIGEGVSIGPFARLRPGTRLADKTRIGNFVETKNATLGLGSKVNHLSYVGDSDVGSNVNIGAGTITCNYDGANKHRTVIGDNAFIGSNTALVAPVTVGEGATIGAGSTIMKEAPADKLTLTRAKQQSLRWKRPVKTSG